MMEYELVHYYMPASINLTGCYTGSFILNWTHFHSFLKIEFNDFVLLVLVILLLIFYIFIILWVYSIKIFLNYSMSFEGIHIVDLVNNIHYIQLSIFLYVKVWNMLNSSNIPLCRKLPMLLRVIPGRSRKHNENESMKKLALEKT